MTMLIGIYGASGFGREVAPLVTLAHPKSQVVFIDDDPRADTLNGRPVWTFETFIQTPAQKRSAVVAIADPRIREKLSLRCRDADLPALSIAHPSVVTLDNVDIGQGALLCSFVTLTSNIRIGRFFHGNIYSYVAHDCVIGDFVTFAPAVHCNGNVHIEDHAYIGTGAIIRQGNPGKPLVIGTGAVVGMGAVVTKDVPPGATVVGNPARPLEKA
jgi:sugar O-acyltransferase (sialic acid O-acetyltransferase NeuD family)